MPLSAMMVRLSLMSITAARRPRKAPRSDAATAISRSGSVTMRNSSGPSHSTLPAGPRPLTPAPAREQGESNRAAERRAEIAGGNVADHLHRRGRQPAGSGGDDLAAFGHDKGRILGEESDELRPSGPRQIAARQAALADEIRLLLVDDPAHAEIERRDRAVGIVADSDIALLGPQHVPSLAPHPPPAPAPPPRPP